MLCTLRFTGVGAGMEGRSGPWVVGACSDGPVGAGEEGRSPEEVTTEWEVSGLEEAASVASGTAWLGAIVVPSNKMNKSMMFDPTILLSKATQGRGQPALIYKMLCMDNASLIIANGYTCDAENIRKCYF